jgi:hypothetical protein
MNDAAFEPVDEERPEDIIDEMEKTLDELHAEFSEAATIVGEERERIRAIRPVWESLAESDTESPEYADVFHTGVHALAVYRDQLNDIRDQHGVLAARVSEISGTSASTVAITAVTQSFFSQGLVSITPAPPTLPPRDEARDVDEALRRLDPALLSTYQGVREALYGTRADPERAALYEVRQVFDHFFSILAPEDRVRDSKYWQPKEVEKPDLVTRDERLRYAANTHARTPILARTLIGSSRHMLSVHDALSSAHKRGELDVNKARSSIREMDTLLRQWIAFTDSFSDVSNYDVSA